MIDEWVDRARSSAEINREIQSMDNLAAEVWGVRSVSESVGFDSDASPMVKVCDCSIRLDLWKGAVDDGIDLVGKLPSDVDVRAGDHLKIETSGSETGSRGIDDSPVGMHWDLVVQAVREFGGTKELELKWT